MNKKDEKQRRAVPSGRKVLLNNIRILLAVTVVSLLCISVYSVWVYEKQLVYCNQAAIDLYENNLTNTLEDALLFDQSVYAANQDFRLLSIERPGIPESSRLGALKNLKQLLQSQPKAYEAVYIFNESGSVSYYYFGRDFCGNYMSAESMELMKEIREFRLNREDAGLWELYESGGRHYLMNAYCYRTIYIMTVVDLQAFTEYYDRGGSNVRFAIYSGSEILAGREYAERAGVSVGDMKRGEENRIRLNLEPILVRAVFHPDYGIGLAGLIPTTGIWSSLWTFLLVMGIVLAALALMFFLVYRQFRGFMLYPLEQITRMSRHLDEPDYELPAKGGQRELEEFVEIRTSLVNLMNQKNRLEEENLRRSRETDHALLQYYQLQTRSHFFLNCLKSIYNMTENGENEKTRRMITLFSSHLRYVFHDNLSLVKLSDELEEVQSYYQIIQLDHARPLLLSVDADESLLGEQVPPLCIQTFLENSHKHNAQSNKILRFLVKADRVELEGRPYLRLRLSDNGSGYTEEVLEKLSEREPDQEFEQYHVGINNLKRRIRLIYGEDYQLAFYNLPGGGACNVICLPLQVQQTGEGNDTGACSG